MALRGMSPNSRTSAPVPYTFATLPTPASATPGQQYWVTDVGTDGSYWISDGVSWSPVNGTITLYSSGCPFIIPSSGSLSANGALTLTTPLDKIYASAYIYFPANLFTNSPAGFYYCTMTSPSAGTCYNNRYTQGNPVIPSTLIAITTGLGVFITVTTSVPGPTFVVPGNAMGPDGHLYLEAAAFCRSSLDVKAIQFSMAGSSVGSTSDTLTPAIGQQTYVANQSSASRQMFFCTSFATTSSGSGSLTKDTTGPFLVSLDMRLFSVLDYLVCGWFLVRLDR